ncbi:MAG: glycosyltransferase family 2 protein [Sphingobacteriia bacterium]|nr:MAG: glycosyltransferase family 2 protein [Sphingobacteriia bacterium]
MQNLHLWKNIIELQLSVIIVNYRAYNYLALCLFSVELAARGLACEIWVVDNESDPLQLLPLQQHFPKVNWLINSENIGFAKANNQAILLSKGEYILFLNPDTMLPENTFKQGLQYLSKHIGVGAIGVQMINLSGQFLPESKRAFPSLWASFTKLTGLWRVFPGSSFLNHYALGEMGKTGIHAIEVLAGAFMMVRATLVKSLGGFDEQFFMYGEDIDLSKRITDAGYSIHYLGCLKIIHCKGASGPYTQHRDYHFYHSMQLFVRKYQSRYGGAIGLVLLMPAIRIIAILSGWKSKLKTLGFTTKRSTISAPYLDLEMHTIEAIMAEMDEKPPIGWLVYKAWKIYMG